MEVVTPDLDNAEMGTLWSVDPLGGQLLRYAICVVLKRRDRWMSIGEIVRDIQRLGFNLPEAANKAVADAIRWEVCKGRVRKHGRGKYAYGGAPRTTEHRMRQRIREALGDTSISLQHGTQEDTHFDPESVWTETAGDGRRALDLDAVEAYERGLKTASR